MEKPTRCLCRIQLLNISNLTEAFYPILLLMLQYRSGILGTSNSYLHASVSKTSPRGFLVLVFRSVVEDTTDGYIIVLELKVALHKQHWMTASKAAPEAFST